MTTIDLLILIAVFSGAVICAPSIVRMVRQNMLRASEDIKVINSAAANRLRREDEIAELKHRQAVAQERSKTIRDEGAALAMLETVQGLGAGNVPPRTAPEPGTSVALRQNYAHDAHPGEDAYYTKLRRELRPPAPPPYAAPSSNGQPTIDGERSP